MKKIEILGDGCVNCRNFEKNVRQAVAEAGVEADVRVTGDPEALAAYQILRLPGLAIDGKPQVQGQVLEVAEIRKLLEE